jgi:hypothetical protein
VTRLVALDTATVTGVADGLIGGNPTLSSVNFARALDRHGDVYCRVMRWAKAFLANGEQPFLVLEAAVPLHNQLLQQGIRACILAVAVDHKIPYREVPCRTWRHYAFGTAKMQRKQAKAAALTLCDRLGWHAVDDNAAEASLIWAWGCAQVDPRNAIRIEPLFLPREKRSGRNARTKSC